VTHCIIDVMLIALLI